MALDPVLLSRLQWMWVISWHILLPAFTVGLASYVAVLEGFYFFTERPIWLRLSGFWTKLLAVSFGMVVVSGIIMPFQFGTNWSRFSDAAGNVISPLLAYEGLTAFFLEASFLGVLLFGRRLVPRGMHFFAAVMVAAGTLFSSFWILSTNSWMQTPAGYELVGIPDDASATMNYAIDVPYLGSLILTHSLDGKIEGLKDFPADQRPPVAAPFFGFRIMVGIGVIMLAVVVAGQVMRRGGRRYRSRWFLLLCQAAAPLSFIAVIAGWVTTEVGRQPWTVYGLMHTADSVSPSLTGNDVAISLALYVVVYLVMFPTGLAFMSTIVRAGAGEADAEPGEIEGALPAGPFAAAHSGPATEPGPGPAAGA
jgi:cytochrome bd-type quinol oxidase subunit 1